MKLQRQRAYPPAATGLRRLAAVLWVALLVGSACTATAQAQAENEQTIAIGVTPEGITCVLGGAQGGRIVPAQSLVPGMKHRQEYTLERLGKTGPIAWAIGKPAPISEGEDCEDQYEQELSLGPAELGTMQAALSGDLEDVRARLPDSLQELPLDHAPAVREVRRLLDARGMTDAPVKLVQVLEADINGDGSTDMVINAVNTERELARRGEYSLLLVKPGESTRIIEAAVDVTLEDSEFPGLLIEHDVVSISDLDGNGTMEMVVYGSYYYGDGWLVLELKDGVAETVLACGCGG